MKINKNNLTLLFLISIFVFDGCRSFTDENNNAELLVDPNYSTYFLITSPPKYSIWKPGEQLQISWITSGNVGKVDIQLYKKSDLILVLKTNYSNRGSFSWNIPNDINQSLHYQIKISNHNNPDEYELSDRFAIND